jgi:nucleoside 2-deoxyribosyltransferase
MRAYLAAPYAARAQVRQYAEELEAIGYTVTSTWLTEDHDINPGTVGAATALADEDVDRHASTDFADIRRSDVLVLITESVAELVGGTATTGGRHIETGFAIALDKHVVVVGTPENVFHRSRYVDVAPDWHAACLLLASRLVSRERERDLPQAVCVHEDVA